MIRKQPEMTDQELWQSLATGREGAAGTISDIDLAAWLEGRLPEDQSQRIDRAMSDNAALRQAALELSDILGRPLPAPPDRLIVRAKALVGFETEREAPNGFGGFLASLFPRGLRAAMAPLALVVAVGGFMLGGGLGESYAQDNRNRVVAHDSLSELGEFFRDGGI